MKKIIILSITLLVAPISAGPNCIDKQEHSLECPCNCDVIKGRKCIECFHLQDARPSDVIHPLLRSSSYEGQAQKTKVRVPEHPQAVLEKLAAQYVKNKYDV